MGSWFLGSRIWSVLDRAALPLKAQVHSLGVLLDSKLSLDVKVALMVPIPTSGQLWMFLNQEGLSFIFITLITSCIDYCNALYWDFPWKCCSSVVVGCSLTGSYGFNPEGIVLAVSMLPSPIQGLNNLGPTFLSECFLMPATLSFKMCWRVPAYSPASQWGKQDSDMRQGILSGITPFMELSPN